MPSQPSGAVPNLSRTQRRRKWLIRVLSVAVVAVVFAVGSAWPPDSLAHHAIENAGIGLILICIAGRTWSTLYIGGHKKESLIDIGPYSLVRNPLYVFSLIGAVGVGLTVASLVVGAAFGLITFVIFNGVIAREEQYLSAYFGAPYRDYCDRVSRWWPQFAGWRDAEEIVTRPALIAVTFRDACLFLLAVPIAATIGYLQQTGTLPALVYLP